MFEHGAERARRQGLARDGAPVGGTIRDAGTVGLALVRAAATVLHTSGELVRVTPEWVDAHVRTARHRADREEE